MSRRHQHIITVLRERFPRAFSRKQPRPLKVGLSTEIAKLLNLDPRDVGIALGRYYANKRAYLWACTEGADRLDLDGNGAGVVTAAQAAHAKRILEERKATWRAKRDAREAHEGDVEAKRRMKLPQAEAEHQRQQRQQAQAVRDDIRKPPTQATVTRTRPVVVKISRPRLSLRRS